MSEQKESSVLFSLKELMNLEEDRIRGEEEQRDNARRAEEEARMAAERAARDAEESRIRAEEERRRAEEQRTREEAARLEAIRHAEVEKARVEAEQQARLAAMSNQQQHERQLAAINQDQSKKKLRNILIGLSAGFIIIGTGVGIGVYKNHQATELQRIALEEEAKKAKEDKQRLEAQLSQQASKVNGLEASLAAELVLARRRPPTFYDLLKR